MAVAKITGSGKGVLFIDDDGRVFSTSVTFLRQLLMGTLKTQFILLTRLPFDIVDTRFKNSPLYDPKGVTTEGAKKAETQTGDGLSPVRRENEKQKQDFKDKKVW